MEISIIETTDNDLIESVLNHPEIVSGAIEGGGQYIASPSSTERYCAVYFGSILCGIISFEQRMLSMYECHVSMLPDFRGQFAVDSVKAFYCWALKNIHFGVLISHASSIHRFGAVFCRLCGMKRVGVIPNAVTYGDMLYDMTVYQITREDIINGR